MVFQEKATIKAILILACAAGGLLSEVPASAAAETSDNRLPETLGHEGPHVAASRSWTIPDIVEVTRITGIAIQGQTRTVAFILKQPSIARGEDRYALYLLTADKLGSAHKVLDANYLADLQWRPGTTDWTFRGDLGEGVQLYEMDSAGHTRGLVVNPQLARVGGSDGQVGSCCDWPRMTGVLSYQWSPDGSALWYSKLMVLSVEQRQAFDENGVIYKESKMSPPTDILGPPAALTVELHLFTPDSGKDRTLAAVPGDRPTAQVALQKEEGMIGWTDSRHIAYRLFATGEDGERSATHWLVDTDTGQTQPESGRTYMDAWSALSTADGDLVVRRDGASQKLIALARDGAIAKDYGAVDYTRLGAGYWHDERSGRFILEVHYPDHDGLAAVPGSPGAAPLKKLDDELTNCAFNTDVSFGVCSRETLTLAPELVGITPGTGRLVALARPNARYDEINPLRTVGAQWTNRFGAINHGYITYPRDFRAGHKYPVMLVTHSGDALNRFAYDGFQWEYPIQLFAERGYFVLSVNEARVKDAAVLNASATGATNVPVSKMQFEIGYNAIASMEAAAQSLIDEGLADPAQVGIAGYSRGGIVSTLTMSHSKLFRAGANGDTSFYSAGTFWANAQVRALYKGLFGGSPFDRKSYENYLSFSPSARADHFAGPLLQQFTAESAIFGLELDQMLKDANVPAELAFYRDETHIPYHPRRRASAMQLSFDWFDYWLLSRRNPDPSKSEQYQRWDAMAARWRASGKASAAASPKGY